MAGLAVGGAGTAGAFSCGGTTGRSASEITAAAGEPDATVAEAGAPDVGSTTFDVVIMYADQSLPDIGPPAPVPEGGSAWPWPWPNCPAFWPWTNGRYDDSGSELDQIPTEYDDAGNTIRAPDGSACATYPWLGSTTVDECVTSNTAGQGQYDFRILPPCNWCLEAGTATAGPGAANNDDLYTLCLDLYQCIQTTGCYQHDVISCLCGDASITDCQTGPAGPCAQEELAATNTDPTATAIHELFVYYENYAPTADNTAYCGAVLNDVYQSLLSAHCGP